MKVFDVFPFYNELDILELRMQILNPYVDYFVIGQANRTFAGEDKRFHFDIDRLQFSRFSDKVIEHRLVEDINGTPFERDAFQKDSIRRTLDSICASEDIIIFSDVDEIPNPEVLANAFDIGSTGGIAHLAQHLHYYYLDLREISGTLLSYSGEFPGVGHKKWLGTKVVRFEELRPFTMTQLRNPEMLKRGIRVDQGGWHFSYVGGLSGVSVEERARAKINDFAHQELNTRRNRLLLKRRIARGLDPFGRSSARFARVPVDETFPVYLRENLGQYGHLLAP